MQRPMSYGIDESPLHQSLLHAPERITVGYSHWNSENPLIFRQRMFDYQLLSWKNYWCLTVSFQMINQKFLELEYTPFRLFFRNFDFSKPRFFKLFHRFLGSSKNRSKTATREVKVKNMKFSGYHFIRTRTQRESIKSALVYL